MKTIQQIINELPEWIAAAEKMLAQIPALFATHTEHAARLDAYGNQLAQLAARVEALEAQRESVHDSGTAENS